MNPIAKQAAHARAKGRCEKCGKRGSRRNWELHVHHLTYERYGHELVDDLIVLCLECHGQEHPSHTFRTRAGQLRAARIRRKRRERMPAQEPAPQYDSAAIAKQMKRFADKLDRRAGRNTKPFGSF